MSQNEAEKLTAIELVRPVLEGRHHDAVDAMHSLSDLCLQRGRGRVDVVQVVT